MGLTLDYAECVHISAPQLQALVFLLGDHYSLVLLFCGHDFLFAFGLLLSAYSAAVLNVCI